MLLKRNVETREYEILSRSGRRTLQPLHQRADACYWLNAVRNLDVAHKLVQFHVWDRSLLPMFLGGREFHLRERHDRARLETMT